MDEERRGAGDMVRQLIVSLERVAVHGLAAGAVRGATDELESEIPELSEDLRLLLDNSIAVLNGLAVLLAEEPPRRLESMAEATAAGAARGLATTWPVVMEATRDLVIHLEDMLDRVARFAETRAAEVQTPGIRARIAAASGVEGALESLGKGGPQLDAALESAGRSLVRGITSQLRADLQPIRGALRDGRARALVSQVTGGVLAGAREQLGRPFVIAAAAVSAFVGAGLLVRAYQK